MPSQAYPALFDMESLWHRSSRKKRLAQVNREAKRLKKDLVISTELLQAVHLPPEIAVEKLCEVTLRGHDRPTGLFALSNTGSMPGIELRVGEE